MVFFANVFVNLRGSLCAVLKYASAQPLDFLDLGKKSSFMNWKRLRKKDGRQMSYASKRFQGPHTCENCSKVWKKGALHGAPCH